MLLIALPRDITAGVHSVIKGSLVLQNIGSEVCFVPTGLPLNVSPFRRTGKSSET